MHLSETVFASHSARRRYSYENPTTLSRNVFADPHHLAAWGVGTKEILCKKTNARNVFSVRGMRRRIYSAAR